MPETVTSPSGKTLLKVGTHTTTPSSDATPKPIPVKIDTVEVVISNSRIISAGSQFGHTAIIIDDVEYGRAHPGWDKDTREHYLYRQQVRIRRDSWGYVLRVTPEEKQTILNELHRRMKEQKDYSLVDNSCSSNIADVLELAGIQAYDPRWAFGMVSPADLMTGLKHSKRLVTEKSYPKK